MQPKRAIDRMVSSLTKLDAVIVQLEQDGYRYNAERLRVVARFITDEIENLRREEDA